MNTEAPIPADDDEAQAPPSSDRRVWKRWNPTQGSSALSLKAMAVLYDAGHPVSLDELADRLFPQLDVYARSYVEAWWQHRRDSIRASLRKRSGATVHSKNQDRECTADARRALRLWLSHIFARRVYTGRSLIRDSDGRYRPGPRPAQAQRIDGTIVAFTPETRRELEQSEHDQGRTHLAMVEWDRITKKLDLTTVEARIQLLTLLLRRLLLSGNKQSINWPFNERSLGLEFRDLLRLADTKGVQRAILQRALDALLPAQ